MKRVGLALFTLVLFMAVAAAWLAPNAPDRTFADLLYAPPTPVRPPSLGFGETGSPRGFYIYPQRLVNRLERRFEPDMSRPATLQWFTNGRLVTVDESRGGPLLVLGADAFGRDIFARLLFGARTSLSLSPICRARPRE